MEDGRGRKLTLEERRKVAADVLAQAILELAVERMARPGNSSESGQNRASEELACSPEQRLHVHETAGDGRQRQSARDMEEER